MNDIFVRDDKSAHTTKRLCQGSRYNIDVPIEIEIFSRTSSSFSKDPGGMGVINQQGRPFTHGFEIHLEKATLYFDLAVLAGGTLQITPLTVLDSKGKADQPKMPPGDPMLSAFDAEIPEVVKSAAINKSSPILSGSLARDAIVLCHKQTQAVKSGKTTKV